ncbi:MAG: hypothetical protein MJ223_01650 [Mycoplasmoidaceae bacterium]|nr:hypothetical protein [Mycoplasmoidaceae bacterium]
MFGDKNCETILGGVINYDSYIEFDDDDKNLNQFEIEDCISNFVFSDKNCIDMAICSVDFSNATGETKEKLIRLNDFRKQNGYINKFVNSDDSSIIKKNKYVGGYPAVQTTYLGQLVFGGK